MGLVVITMFAPLLGVVTAVAAAHGATLPAGAKMTRPLLRTYKNSRPPPRRCSRAHRSAKCDGRSSSILTSRSSPDRRWLAKLWQVKTGPGYPFITRHTRLPYSRPCESPGAIDALSPQPGSRTSAAGAPGTTKAA